MKRPTEFPIKYVAMENVEYMEFEPEAHLSGVLGILRSIGWDNFHYDSELTRKSMTAPGVATFVATCGEEVVGFAQVFTDGVACQTHLSLLAVDERWRRKGVARELVDRAFGSLGAERMDLIASDESVPFYKSLRHRENFGFRLYPQAGREA